MSCQLDHVDHARPNWFLADLDRRSLERLQREAREEVFGEARGGARLPLAPPLGGGIRMPGAVTEVLQAIVRGPVRCQQTPLRGLLRSALWALVPTPEVFLLVLDWTWSNPGAPRPSRALPPLVDALLRLDLRTVRKLAFAQTLTNARELQGGEGKGRSGRGAHPFFAPSAATAAAAAEEKVACAGAEASARGGEGETSVLIGERNNQVVAALRQAELDGVANVAVLYGGLHMPDLEAKLQRELGLTRAGEPTWLTAWDIPLGRNAPGESEGPASAKLARLLGAPLYLVTSSLDWYLCLAAWGDVSSDSAFHAAGVLAAVYGSYVLRRGVIYWSLSKWLFDWDRGLFGDSGGASTS